MGAGLTEAMADLLVDFDVSAARGDLDYSSEPLRRLIGRPLTTLRQAVAAALRTEAEPAR